MNVSELLDDALGRVREQMPDLVAGLSDDDLAWRPDPEANSIAWLVWHLTRIEDDHVAGVAGTEQVWVADGWAERFGLPFGAHEHGYSMSTADVGKVRVERRPARRLLRRGGRTHRGLRRRRSGPTTSTGSSTSAWDPPVTLGVRLITVVNEVNAHLGQAQYVRGLLERR